MPVGAGVFHADAAAAPSSSLEHSACRFPTAVFDPQLFESIGDASTSRRDSRF